MKVIDAGLSVQDPYAKALSAWSEREADGRGGVVQVATLILAAPRCALRCNHCDLGSHGISRPMKIGQIVRQVEEALERLPRCDWIKLYNGGNFVDTRSIPLEDYPRLAKICNAFSRVIVENHPRMTHPRLRQFAEGLSGRLEVAMGLETSNRHVLQRLNKGMDLQDYEQATERLHRWGMDTRVFLVAGLPGIESTVIRDSLRSIGYAQSLGARHISIIPLRITNDYLRRWRDRGACPPVTLSGLDRILAKANQRRGGVVTVDLWDLDRLSHCPYCKQLRFKRLLTMNLRQISLPPVVCSRCRQ